MRRNEVGDEVQGEAPPDCSKDVASDLLHPPHHADAVIYFGEELEQKHHQKYRHYELNFFFSYQFRHHQPEYCLNKTEATTT